MNKIEIPLKKTKLILATAFLFFATLYSVYYFINAEEIAKVAFFVKNSNATFNRILGSVLVILFGCLFIFGLKKVLNNKVGLTIDDIGITDHSGTASIGLIKWEDITEFKTEIYNGLKFFVVYVKNQNEYLNKASGLKAKLMKGNIKNYGTPLSISADALKYDFNDLEKLLKDRLSERNK